MKRLITLALVPVLAAGCAAPQPVPFHLVDSGSRIQKGTIFPDEHRIEATIDGQLYKGFYITATGMAYSQSYGSLRSYPSTTVTHFWSNSVRAQLTSDEGQQLNCEFLFDSVRAVGECRSPAGAVFQLVADGKAESP